MTDRDRELMQLALDALDFRTPMFQRAVARLLRERLAKRLNRKKHD